MTRQVGGGPWTVVSFHAHPDDEALLTAGTLARASAEGHRVVLVVATSGEAGLAAGHPDAEELGARVVPSWRSPPRSWAQRGWSSWGIMTPVRDLCRDTTSTRHRSLP